MIKQRTASLEHRQLLELNAFYCVLKRIVLPNFADRESNRFRIARIVNIKSYNSRPWLALAGESRDTFMIITHLYYFPSFQMHFSNS